MRSSCIKMKQFLTSQTACFLAILLLGSTILCACGNKTQKYNPNENVPTQMVEDDTGRDVEIPEQITRIAPSGATATMILLTLAPDLMVGLSSTPSTLQIPYLPENIYHLPTFGQLYGSKSTLNLEALIDAQPDVIFDLGDRKTTITEDMNAVEKQTGIPALFYEATLEALPNAYRQLGHLLGRDEKAEELAVFVEKTLLMAGEKSSKISVDHMLTVMYGTGATGLAVNANESSQAQVIDLIGAKNAIIPDTVTNKGGGTSVSMETVYSVDPDVIILTSGGPYEQLKEGEWSELTAVKNDRYYEIPSLPYCWMSSPPSVNMVIGVWWLGQLVYPEIYNDYEIIEVAREFYRLFWSYDLTEEEAREMLSNSYYR